MFGFNHQPKYFFDLSNGKSLLGHDIPPFPQRNKYHIMGYRVKRSILPADRLTLLQKLSIL